jgi:molybdenum cofactor cytidylyltransferase
MIHAVVLAAGRSSRMGDRVQKLLLPFGGQAVIQRVVGEVCRAPIDRTVVVLGADRDRVRSVLADTPAQFTTNPDPTGDMLSSVRCGLREVPRDCDAVLVALGDQPGISCNVVTRMVEHFRPGERDIVVPTCDGDRGHPLLFDGGYRGEVLERYDDLGLRGLLRAHPDRVRELETGDPAVLSDIDYPVDYRRELARLREDEEGE